MFELKTAVRAALLADPTLPVLLNFVPGQVGRAVYLNHIASIREVKYPCVSLFFNSTGPRPAELFATGVILNVDIWTEEQADPAAPGIAATLAGAHQISGLIRNVLHMAHQRDTITHSAFKLRWLSMITDATAEDFEVDKRLHHVSDQYRAVLIGTGDEGRFPNA